MSSKGKILGLVLDGKFIPSKYEKRFLRDHNFIPLSNEKELREIVGKAWFGKINKKKLKEIIYIGKNADKVLALFPEGIFQSDTTIGTIEIEKNEDVYIVNFVSYETGEIKQSRYNF